jgi:hypothetical protein
MAEAIIRPVAEIPMIRMHIRNRDIFPLAGKSDYDCPLSPSLLFCKNCVP